MALTEELPKDVPAEILEKRVTPVQLEIQDLPTEVVEPDVITTVTKRTLKIVRAVQHEIEEMPTETIRDIAGEEIPSELTLEELTTPKLPAAEVSMPNVYVAPKAKKPTTKWEAPETLEVVIEKPQDTKIAVTEVVKPEETVTEEIEVLPEQATSTAQIALYETTKPTVSMTFKVPEELKPEGTQRIWKHEFIECWNMNLLITYYITVLLFFSNTFYYNYYRNISLVMVDFKS